MATRDGGVVVMIGRTLLKYDKNLKLKAEVEIDIDRDAMHPIMRKMKGKDCGCSRHEKMRPKIEAVGKPSEE